MIAGVGQPCPSTLHAKLGGLGKLTLLAAIQTSAARPQKPMAVGLARAQKLMASQKKTVGEMRRRQMVTVAVAAVASTTYSQKIHWVSVRGSAVVAQRQNSGLQACQKLRWTVGQRQRPVAGSQRQNGSQIGAAAALEVGMARHSHLVSSSYSQILLHLLQISALHG